MDWAPIVAVLSVGPAAASLVSIAAKFLASRRSQLSIKITRGDQHITLDVSNAKDVDKLLRELGIFDGQGESSEGPTGVGGTE